jgi:hypothetical protein
MGPTPTLAQSFAKASHVWTRPALLTFVARLGCRSDATSFTSTSIAASAAASFAAAAAPAAPAPALAAPSEPATYDFFSLRTDCTLTARGLRFH